ncbi:olfactory receptor 10J4-like [Chanos chanos]|uniref:Olfactory receptor n=1 Tax=Chanos chanos TaxID=29144 RepID=A0A6J2VLE9_CHACN|nr:olfactory receptor 10J4-like [Chanos chanos]
MANGSTKYLYLAIFENQGYIRYVFFSLGLILYCAILIFNVIILLVICVEKALHQPMYLLISCLSLNSLYGTAGFFPRFLTDLISELHTISVLACHIQTFVIYTYASCEFTMLTLMAYDRYVAICKPLHYHSIITLEVLFKMIIAAWVYPISCIGLPVYLTTQLPLCDDKITKLYCNGWSIVELSCGDKTPILIVSFIISVTTLVLPMALIFYSYIRILIICQRGSPEFKVKAFHTCLPHIVTFVIFSITIFCEMVLSRYEPGELPLFVTVILSLEFLLIPPVLNPLLYGFSFLEIRKKISCLLTKCLILRKFGK